MLTALSAGAHEVKLTAEPAKGMQNLVKPETPSSSCSFLASSSLSSAWLLVPLPPLLRPRFVPRARTRRACPDEERPPDSSTRPQAGFLRSLRHSPPRRDRLSPWQPRPPPAPALPRPPPRSSPHCALRRRSRPPTRASRPVGAAALHLPTCLAASRRSPRPPPPPPRWRPAPPRMASRRLTAASARRAAARREGRRAVWTTAWRATTVLPPVHARRLSLPPPPMPPAPSPPRPPLLSPPLPLRVPPPAAPSPPSRPSSLQRLRPSLLQLLSFPPPSSRR
mmetsp:Transcript_31502/g.76617  ORF Transcript_31502/g.76617 Transcript_31502/m.76617 type:complete len:280 (+) Transcript_31502:247-1086(+)